MDKLNLTREQVAALSVGFTITNSKNTVLDLSEDWLTMHDLLKEIRDDSDLWKKAPYETQRKIRALIGGSDGKDK